MTERAFVFLVDDDLSVREALGSLLRSANFEFKAFASAEEFLGQTIADGPACLLLDISMPGIGGLELQRRLTDAGREIPIIFVTGHGDVPSSVSAMKAGALDVQLKPFSEERLLSAVEEAIQVDRCARRARAAARDLRMRFSSLSRREAEVMQGVVAGLLNKQVAAKMGITEITVKAHRSQVMQKMKAASFADLVRMSESLK